MTTTNKIGLLLLLSFVHGGMTMAAEGDHSTRINAVIHAWEQGRPAIGRGVVDFSFDEAVRWSRTDLDFLFCDMEHRPVDLNQMRVFLQALMDRNLVLERGDRLIRPTPLLRIPAYGRELNQWLIKQALDLGVPGVIFPSVSTARQAEYIVAGSRYPQAKGAAIPNPVGMRGVSPDMAVRYWGLSFMDYVGRADLYPLNPKGETLVILQIEEREGFQNLDEILKVKGVGMVMIGPADLSFALGHPGHPEDPEVEAAIQLILTKSKAAGVKCGIVNPATKVVERAEQGFGWISTGDIDAATLQRARSVRVRR
jgi:4-hydroxy-2-oxoheptanedioate aldolase